MEHCEHDCVLVDAQSFDILCRDRIGFDEMSSRNDETRKVGEFFLVWLPMQFNPAPNAQDEERA